MVSAASSFALISRKKKKLQVGQDPLTDKVPIGSRSNSLGQSSGQ
jgi:hypothetical protein